MRKQKIIEDISYALEQGRCAVYRRRFDSSMYEYMGEYIQEITGYAAHEISPEIWDGLIIKAVQKGELQNLSLEEANRKVRSGAVERWLADVQIQTKSGEIRWVSDLSTVLRDKTGQCVGCLGVLMDITDRKNDEQQLAALTSTLREKNQEMEADLALAREVQLALITQQPTHFSLDGSAGRIQLEFHHRYLPASTLAGDFFEILPLSDHKVGVFFCDVIGHGIRAALLTTFLRGLIEELMPHAGNPGVLLGKINHGLRAVFGAGDAFLFATAFYAVIDYAQGQIQFANAGHTTPLCLRPVEGLVEMVTHASLEAEPALGIVDEYTYTTSEYSLAKQESLLLYTDGLIETCDGQQEMYGEDRLMTFINQHCDLNADDLLDALMDDARRFSGSKDFEDDVCLLSLSFSSSDR